MPYLLQDASREQDGAAGAPTEPGDEEGAAWQERAAASVERLREAISAAATVEQQPSRPQDGEGAWAAWVSAIATRWVEEVGERRVETR